MGQLFSAFIILGVILELFEHNRARYVALPHKKVDLFLTSLVSSSIIYLLFIVAGWYASLLMPEMTNLTSTIVSVIALTLLIVYNFIRDSKYVSAGNMIYGNFKLFALISIGRGVLHLLTGFVLALLGVDLFWMFQSYGLGIILFGLAVILAKGDKIKIFGIAVGYIKVSAFIIAAVLILINLLYGHS